MAESYETIWYVIRWACSALAGCAIFKKKGIPMWKSLIPVYGEGVLYKLVWNANIYSLYLLGVILYYVVLPRIATLHMAVFAGTALLLVAAEVIRFVFCRKLAGYFGRKFLFAVGLWIFEPVFKIWLASAIWTNGAAGQEEERRGWESRKKKNGIRIVGAAAAIFLMGGYAFHAWLLGTQYLWITPGNFPDRKFREFLIIQPYGRDLRISRAELASVCIITCSDAGISNLEGIEHFWALQWLDCSQNRLTGLDISENRMLHRLECSGNRLESLEFGEMDTLGLLDCTDNYLSELDVSGSHRLERLLCAGNRLSELNLDRNDQLKNLDCSGNCLQGLKKNVLISDSMRNYEMSDQRCEIQVTYDEKDGVYRSAEGALKPEVEVLTPGVSVNPENGQITLEDPGTESAEFIVRDVLSWPADGSDTDMTGTIVFVREDK
ncbi:DUF5684 domain-containing protein [Clostridium sp. Marseille-P3244]|uniref:DUF5684 domain-containing protein n=1 Tax=Clostridium sp. Marseille-P3244 TaxID=1871020 RepID=UPI000930343F|nr:DUF5684 domain-containing protein [Clostridium sp. Marseille-P3244]